MSAFFVWNTRFRKWMAGIYRQRRVWMNIIDGGYPLFKPMYALRNAFVFSRNGLNKQWYLISFLVLDVAGVYLPSER
jgi:hypothetical protein